MRLTLTAIIIIATTLPAMASAREVVVRDRAGSVISRSTTDSRSNTTVRDRAGAVREQWTPERDGYAVRDRAGRRLGTVQGR